MSILIVALPRTGSTELGRSISIKKKYQNTLRIQQYKQYRKPKKSIAIQIELRSMLF